MKKERIPIIEDATQEKLSLWAGRGYFAGNATMTFSGVAKEYAAGTLNDISDLWHEPVTFGVGVAYLVSSFVLAKWGDTNKGMAGSMAVGGTGAAVMTWSLLQGDNALAAVGSGIAMLAMGQACYQAVNNELKEMSGEKPVREQKHDTAKSEFQELVQEITTRYPYLPLGITEFTANAFILVASLMSKSWELAGIAAVWTGASVLLAGSKPTSKMKNDQATPQ